MEKYQDPSLSPKERAKDLFDRMTPEERKAQLCAMIPKEEWDEEMEYAARNGIGGVFAGDMYYMDSLQEAADFQRDFQTRIMEKSRFGIPAVFYVRGLTGAFIRGATTYPHGLNRAAAFDPRLENHIGATVGRQAGALGVTMILIPELFEMKAPWQKARNEASYLWDYMVRNYSEHIDDENVAERRHYIMTLAMDPYYNDGVEEIANLMDFARVGGTEDERVLSTLEAKFYMGLFENPFALTGEELEKTFHHEDDYEVTRIAAEESLILLKNDGILPLKREITKIAVIGPAACDNEVYYPGQAPINKKCATVLDKIKAKRTNSTITYAAGFSADPKDTSGYEEARKLMTEADLAIITLSSISVPAEEAFLKAVMDIPVRKIGIHFGDWPISIEGAQTYFNALIEAVRPAEAGADAIYDVLTGKVNPGGRLPLTVLKTGVKVRGEKTSPSNILYPFGYGLSFTEFAYSNLKMETEEISGDQDFVISVDIENTGAIAGTEIMQLYWKHKEEPLNGITLNFCGFKKMFLLPGEKRRVQFAISSRLLGKRDAEENLSLAAGAYTLHFGRNSQDIEASGELTVTKDIEFNKAERLLVSSAKVL